MINRIVLTGRLTGDPEERFTNDGDAIAKFRIAVDRVRKGRNEDPDADFFNVVCFRKTAEFVNRYISRGDLVGVDGRLQMKNYEDRDGSRRLWVEVIADQVQSLARSSNNSRSDQDEDRREERPSTRRSERSEERQSSRTRTFDASNEFDDDDDDPFAEE